MALVPSSQSLSSGCQFGFLQSKYSPEETPYKGVLPKCLKCNSRMFPVNEPRKIACPVCNPGSHFIPGSYRIGEGFEPRHLFFFIFDLSIDLSTTTTLLLSLAEEMSSPLDMIVAICVARDHATFVRQERGIAIFERVFDSRQSYELKSTDIIETIIPSLPALYATEISGSKVDIMPVLNYAALISHKKNFAIFTFLAENTTIYNFSFERARLASKAIVDAGGVLHFVSSNDHLLLSSLAGPTFGTISKSAEFTPSLLHKLVLLSRPSRIKLTFPGAVKTEQALCCKSLVRSNRIKATHLLSFGVIMKAPETIPHVLNILEETETIFGKFVTLHQFKSSDDPVQLPKEYFIKKVAQNIFVYLWSGRELGALYEEAKATGILKDTFLDTDHEILMRLYYTLFASFDRLDLFERGCCAFSGPFVVAKGTVVDGEKDIDEKWPYTVTLVKNDDEYVGAKKSIGFM